MAKVFLEPQVDSCLVGDFPRDSRDNFCQFDLQISVSLRRKAVCVKVRHIDIRQCGRNNPVVKRIPYQIADCPGTDAP